MILVSIQSLAYTLSFIFVFLVLPLIIFLSILKAKRRSPEARGQRGEDSVSGMLSRIAEQRGGYVINDVIIPNGNRTAQIDHIYFAKNGVFLIETKNYSGRVYGNEEQTYWTQVLSYGNEKNSLYNPIKQNSTHMYALKKIIGSSVEVTPLVIFVQGNTEYINSKKVYTLRQARDLILNSPTKFSEKNISNWYSKIQYYKDHPISTKEEHIEHVKQKSSSMEEENQRRKRRRKVVKILKKL